MPEIIEKVSRDCITGVKSEVVRVFGDEMVISFANIATIQEMIRSGKGDMACMLLDAWKGMQVSYFNEV